MRGRNLLSPLLGRTHFAYAAWIARLEPKTWPKLAVRAHRPPLVVVIDAQTNPSGISATLQSSQRGTLAPDRILILGQSMPDPECVSVPFALVRNLSEFVRELSAENQISLIALQAGDCLSPRAIELFDVAAAGDASVSYADDDLLDRRGRRCDPHFKPEWNAELFVHHDFISGAATLRITPALLAALAREDAIDWMVALTRAAIHTSKVPPRHIPHVLVHRIARPEPVLPLRSIPTEGTIWPSISLIIPTRNQLPLLRPCIAGLEATSYPWTECLIIDNGSDDPATLAFLAALDPARFRVLRMPGPFNFAALNNAAVEKASGEYLCFLNNDVSMHDPDWLQHLVKQAQRPEVGAVGARLHYPDGTVQHAGVVLGVGGGAAHAHRGQRPGQRGYFHRADLPQYVSAVTAACLVVARQKFLAVAGYDADAFAVAFNDVDLCAKLNAQGWQSFYEPRAVLLHHESKSRGTDLTPQKRARFAGELGRLKERWRTDVQVDPFHHPALSRFSDTFVVGL